MCLKTICEDKNIERREQNSQLIREKRLNFPNQWNYITLEVLIPEQNEVVRMTLDPSRRDFEGQLIMNPFDCLLTSPYSIEFCLTRLPDAHGECTIQWFFHYHVGVSNATLEIVYPINKPSAIQLCLRIHREEIGRPDPEVMVCEFHKKKMNRRLFRILSSLHIPDTLQDTIQPHIQNTWPEVKEFAINIISQKHSHEHSKVQVYIDVCEDPTISKTEFFKTYFREMEHVGLNVINN